MLKLEPKAKKEVVNLRLTGKLPAPDKVQIAYDVVHKSDLRQTAYKLTSSSRGLTVVAATPFVEGGSDDETRACNPLLSGSLGLVDAFFEKRIDRVGDVLASWGFQSKVLSAALQRRLSARSKLEVEAEMDMDTDVRSQSFSAALTRACGDADKLNVEARHDAQRKSISASYTHAVGPTSKLNVEARCSTPDVDENDDDADQGLSLGCSVGYATEIAEGRSFRASLEQPMSFQAGDGRLAAQYVDRALEPNAAWIAKVTTAWPSALKKAPEISLVRQWSF